MYAFILGFTQLMYVFHIYILIRTDIKFATPSRHTFKIVDWPQSS